jgi:hypothetical protein
MTAMTFVYIEGARSHEKNSFVLEAKGLRTAQDAAHELIGGTEAKAQRMVRLAGRVLEQKPTKMRLNRFFGSAGLSGDKTRDLGYVIFYDNSELGVCSLLWLRRGRCHCAAAS